MNIQAVSFCGKKEVAKYAKQYGPLNPAEQKVKELADKFHDIEIDRTSDGDYVSSKDAQITKEYQDALGVVGKSKFAYMTAVDTIKTQQASVACNKDCLISMALKIANETPSVTKKDLLRDYTVLSDRR